MRLTLSSRSFFKKCNHHWSNAFLSSDLLDEKIDLLAIVICLYYKKIVRTNILNVCTCSADRIGYATQGIMNGFFLLG